MTMVWEYFSLRYSNKLNNYRIRFLQFCTENKGTHQLMDKKYIGLYFKIYR